MLITSINGATIALLKHDLDLAFMVKDLGLAQFFRGIEICQTFVGTLPNRNLSLILSNVDLIACKPTKIHLFVGLKLDGNTR